MPAPINIHFYCAQNFFVDSQLVAGATEVQISAIDLFFRNKPIFIDDIISAGCSIFVVETEFGIPKVDFTHTPRYARVEFNDIIATSDASLPTKFRWEVPTTVKTDTEYAFVVKFDFAGNSFFVFGETPKATILSAPQQLVQAHQEQMLEHFLSSQAAS